ncbi:nucleotidyltransferase domain-containing protein [bacterium]|nr:nucleotidyltransferase domain-containing protein [bacterium]
MLPKKKLKLEAERLIKRFLLEINQLSPKCIILFGSYARGNFTEGSDIDLCVIAKRLPNDELKRRTFVGLYNTPKITAIGFYPQEFIKFLKKRRCFVYDIISDGIVVYDDGFFENIKIVYEKCIREFQMIREANGWRWKKNNETT